MRLFVAVNLPDAERRAVHAATAPLREAGVPVRWTDADSLHVTLKFLGEVEAERARPIGDALAAAVLSVRPFEVTLGGVGGFPDLPRAHVIWVGVEHHPALELLANDVEGALRPFGFEPELKPFRPHITIGRARRDAARGAMRPLAALADGLDWAGMTRVTSVDLMESRLGGGAPTYHVVQRAVFGGGE